VVGILIKLIPLLKILEINPAVSPVIPPPTLIIKSERLNFFSKSSFKITLTYLKDFDFSLASKE
tara:strand:- start:756 stop:947 length:192 start_codon:yes stop_codon:yes gene_type:complete